MSFLERSKSKFQNYLKTKKIEFTVGADKRKFDKEGHTQSELNDFSDD